MVHWVKGYKDANGRIRDAHEGDYQFAKYNKKVGHVMDAGGWLRHCCGMYVVMFIVCVCIKWIDCGGSGVFSAELLRACLSRWCHACTSQDSVLMQPCACCSAVLRNTVSCCVVLYLCHTMCNRSRSTAMMVRSG